MSWLCHHAWWARANMPLFSGSDLRLLFSSLGYSQQCRPTHNDWHPGSFHTLTSSQEPQAVCSSKPGGNKHLSKSKKSRKELLLIVTSKTRSNSSGPWRGSLFGLISNGLGFNTPLSAAFKDSKQTNKQPSLCLGEKACPKWKRVEMGWFMSGSCSISPLTQFNSGRKLHTPPRKQSF